MEIGTQRLFALLRHRTGPSAPTSTPPPRRSAAPPSRVAPAAPPVAMPPSRPITPPFRCFRPACPFPPTRPLRRRRQNRHGPLVRTLRLWRCWRRRHLARPQRPPGRCRPSRRIQRHLRRPHHRSRGRHHGRQFHLCCLRRIAHANLPASGCHRRRLCPRRSPPGHPERALQDRFGHSRTTIRTRP